MFSSPSRKRLLLWIAAGLLLRFILVIVFPRPGDDDTSDYLELGHNLLHRGIYGFANGGVLVPSLFRLPGYPLFLATMELLFARFGQAVWLNAVYTVQALADLGAGVLLAVFARQALNRRAAEWVLALAMLCPFTAAYAGIAMTECLTVFAISLGIYAAGRALAAAQAGTRDNWALVLAGCAAAMAMLLRPDGAVLTLVLGAGLFWYIARTGAASPSLGVAQRLRSAAASTALFSVIALLPLVPWTVRNWQTFHIFQPLPPRFQSLPGERGNVGFYRWLRTWSVEFVTTADVFWNVGNDSIDLDSLPSSAFDSPAQKQKTVALIDEYNRTNSISAELDDRFAALAAERIHAHPLRYYVVVPALRVADMMFRPRTLEFYLDVYWWRWSAHPLGSIFAVALGLINLAYVALALWGFARGRVPCAWMLGGYLLLRCLTLGTMENPEPRYTIECFPILFVAAGAAIAGRTRNSQKPVGAAWQVAETPVRALGRGFIRGIKPIKSTWVFQVAKKLPSATRGGTVTRARLQSGQ